MGEVLNYTQCPGCDKRVPCTHGGIYPDNGWVLAFDYFGYYSGFDDNVPVLFGQQRSREFMLCHDCVGRLLALFPRLAEMVGPNCHPCEGDTPCCRHAWQATEMFGKDEHGVHMRTAWPDGVWRDDTPMNPYDDDGAATETP